MRFLHKLCAHKFNFSPNHYHLRDYFCRDKTQIFMLSFHTKSNSNHLMNIMIKRSSQPKPVWALKNSQFFACVSLFFCTHQRQSLPFSSSPKYYWGELLLNQHKSSAFFSPFTCPPYKSWVPPFPHPANIEASGCLINTVLQLLYSCFLLPPQANSTRAQNLSRTFFSTTTKWMSLKRAVMNAIQPLVEHNEHHRKWPFLVLSTTIVAGSPENQTQPVSSRLPTSCTMRHPERRTNEPGGQKPPHPTIIRPSRLLSRPKLRKSGFTQRVVDSMLELVKKHF